MATASISSAPSQHRSPFDSYDEDLVWILEKLMGRVGAEFGAICRYQSGEEQGGVMANGGSLSSHGEAFQTNLVAMAQNAVKFDRRRRDDTVNIAQFTLPDVNSGEASCWRLMCLSFLPAENVCIVATVGKPGEAAFAGAQEFVAATLYPVLARYVRLWWMHRIERRRANALGTALDLADIGIMLLDRRSELLFANGKANSLLDLADGLRRNDQSVAAQELIDGARFQAAIQHALYCNAVGYGAVTDSRAAPESARSPILSLRRKDGKRALIVTVMSVDRVAVDPQDPAVIIYALDPEQGVQRLLAPACHIYKLSAAETRLVYHIVGGSSLSEAAGTMRIQVCTARAYLKKVFFKTQTNRQAELVRVMLSSMLRTNSRLDLSLL